MENVNRNEIECQGTLCVERKVMKRILIGLMAMGMLGLGGVSFAQDYRQENYSESRSYGRGWRGLRYDVDRLASFADYVGQKMRRYGASPFMWRRYADIQSDVRRLQHQIYRERGDRSDARRRLDQLRDRLFRLQRDMRFRQSDYYRW